MAAYVITLVINIDTDEHAASFGDFRDELMSNLIGQFQGWGAAGADCGIMKLPNGVDLVQAP